MTRVGKELGQMTLVIEKKLGKKLEKRKIEKEVGKEVKKKAEGKVQLYGDVLFFFWVYVGHSYER
jgi:hypothetical protein